MSEKRCFLISRTDNIGDVVLTLPIATVLKQKYPNSTILFLGRDYVSGVVAAHQDVDRFVSWEALSELSKHDAIQFVKQLAVDVVLHVFPRWKIASLAWRAGIKQRIGTSHRWFHYLFCNSRVSFSRSRSHLHEAQLNLLLLSPLNILADLSLDQIKDILHLSPLLQRDISVKQFLDPDRFNLVIHPLTNGHGREWPLDHFRQLIDLLPRELIHPIITGTMREREQLREPLLEKCKEVTDLTGKLSLMELIELLKECDGLVANGTGPLHIAAALGIKTLGLFPPKVRINADRWQPLGRQSDYLQIDQQCQSFCSNRNCRCISTISIASVSAKIMAWVEKTKSSTS